MCPMITEKDTLYQMHEISWCLYQEHLLPPTSIKSVDLIYREYKTALGFHL